MGRKKKTDGSGDIDFSNLKKEDLITSDPYKRIYNLPTAFDRGIALEKLAARGKELEFNNVKKLYKDYCDTERKQASQEKHVSAIGDQTNELDIGDWIADDTGIRNQLGEIACAHPIEPVAIIRNIDTYEERIQLQYWFRDDNKHTVYTLRESSDTLFNTKNILSLAAKGVSVASGRRAQLLVDYLRDVIDKNRGKLPIQKSVSHLGWTVENTFAPYDGDVEYDGSAAFESTFKAIHSKGDFETWKEEAAVCRKNSQAARLVVAASFASPLIEPLSCLPFFFHLWGMESGTGKTVALMLAASVWGNPTVGGDYVKTFRSTSTGLEMFAGFLKSIPMVIDESQLARDQRGTLRFNVYELASGASKVRSNKNLGVNPGIKWSNCFITSGETPLTRESDGAGAINRVIEVECTPGQKVIQDGHHTVEVVNQNYGFAGKMLVDWLKQDGSMDLIKKTFEKYNAELSKNDTTEKQAQAAALLLVGDMVACKVVFQDDVPMKPSSIIQFLKTAEEVSAISRGYDDMCGWLSQNIRHFASDKITFDAIQGDVYGEIVREEDGRWAFINKVQWDSACENMGISSKALLSSLAAQGLAYKRSDGKTCVTTKVLDGVTTKCIKLKLLNEPKKEDKKDDGFYEVDDDLSDVF